MQRNEMAGMGNLSVESHNTIVDEFAHVSGD